MAATSARLESIRDDVPQATSKHWILFLIQGLVLAVLGLLAIAAPVRASQAERAATIPARRSGPMVRAIPSGDLSSLL